MGASLLLALLLQAPPEPGAMQLKPPPKLAYVHGPSTADAAALRQWLEQQQAVVRLPVRVTLSSTGGVTGGELLSKEPFPLTLDDTALGVSLADRARQHCPGAAQCALWLEGRWRTPFFVTRVVRPVTEAQPLYAELEVADGRLDLAALIDRLGGDAPLPQKQDAFQQLRLSGRDAIPLLIASLSDERPYEVRDITNRMNLPRGANPQPVMATLRVGARCEDLLHAIVTPAVSGSNIKVFSEQVLRIADWRAFWEKRRDRSLADIHKELEPLVREYWKAHGTTQTVP